MAEINKINVDGTNYDIRDAGAARSSHTHSNYLTSHQDLSNYVTLNTDQTITGKKTFGPMKMSGRWNNAGDDEGLIIGKANNGYAGVCLGDPSGVRSVFYLNSTDSAVWRYCSTSGGSSYDLAHPGKSGTIATTGDLSRSYSGTTGGNSGSAVAAVTGVTSDGIANALTGVKVSSSSSAAPGGHTHSVTASGSVTLTNGTAPSLGGATTKYLSATFTGSAVTSGGASATTTSSSGGSSSTYTGYTQPSFTGTAVASGGPSAWVPVLTGNYSNGTLTLSTTNVATYDHAHSVTAAGTVSDHRHTYYAPANHTHTLEHTHSVTAAGSVGLTANNSTATGRIKYVEAQGAFSAGTTPKASASFSGTEVTSSANSGTNFNAATAVGSDGTATVLKGVKASGTANCAPAGHTHSYSGSTN